MLVLSHLPQEIQLHLDTAYEEAQAAFEASLELGGQLDRESERLLEGLATVGSLLSAMPYTSLTEGPDDHDRRRRTLFMELTVEPTAEPNDPDTLVVQWRDGYETLVATMTSLVYERRLRWNLEIHDPAPGRDLERTVRLRPTDTEEAVTDDLRAALSWAQGALGEGYVIRRGATRSEPFPTMSD